MGQLRGRLGKKLNTVSFPINSIEWLIKLAGIKYSDIDIVAVSNNPLSNLMQRFMHSFDFSKFNLIKKIKNKIYDKTSVKDKFVQLCKKNGENINNLKFKIFTVEHHLTHIASAYYLSNFKDRTAAGFLVIVSIMLACENNKINVLENFYQKFRPFLFSSM